jgi:AcrR family transcriptional regulator
MAVHRELVVETAVRLLRDEGEASLGVNRVARALGIKPPSLYNHVDGNPDLRQAVAREGWNQLAHQLSAIGGKMRLHRIAARVRAFARENQALYAVMHSEEVPDTALPHLVEALAERGVHDHADGKALWAAIHGFATLEAGWAEADKVLARLLEALVPMPDDVTEEVVEALRDITEEQFDDWAFY